MRNMYRHLRDSCQICLQFIQSSRLINFLIFNDALIEKKFLVITKVTDIYGVFQSLFYVSK